MFAARTPAPAVDAQQADADAARPFHRGRDATRATSPLPSPSCSPAGLAGDTRGSAPTEIPAIVHEVLQSPGQPLDEATRAGFERTFGGHDFSRVRVHSDARSDASARAIDADAYTVGQHVVLDSTRESAGAGRTRWLLGHELAHTVQQGVVRDRPARIAPDGTQLELEADRAAAGLGGAATLTRYSEPWISLHRKPAKKKKHPAKKKEKDPDANPAAKAAAPPKNPVKPAKKALPPEELADDPYPAVNDGEQPGLFSLSSEGFDFLKVHEGVKQHLYNDSKGHCTIGIGHLVHRGRCNGTESKEFKHGLTDDECYELFRTDLGVYEGAVSVALTSRINQYQFDALVSFCFNIGTAGFRGSGALKQINAKHYSKVPAEMLKWLKPPELKGRRTDESRLFGRGIYAGK